ncbi:MAG TPA: EAL domain-containing protein [Pseudomonadales bacterium]|nr:EAL domain-containing protein [Pseudomonadales bacterium]
MSDQLRVLFIDDSAENEKRVMGLLRVRFTITTLRVANDTELINALDQARWDVVIANYKLIALDGYKAFDHLKKRNLNLPVIFLSDILGENHAVSAIKAGANDYILFSNLPALLGAVEREMIESTLHEHKKNEQAEQQQNEHYLSSLINASDEVIMEFDAAGICQNLWGNARKLLNLSKAELLGEEIEKTFLGFSGEALLNKMRIAMHEKSRQELEFSRFINGTRKHFQARIYLTKHKPDDQGFLIFLRDISQHKDSQKHSLQSANYDSLTGLPNKTLLNDRLELALASARRHQTHLGVLYLDIDNLNTINDSYGHAGGDEVLQEIASRIKQEIRSHDTVARIGDDEFVVLLQNIESPEFAAVVAEKISSVIARPIQVSDQFVVISLSIGISFFPSNGNTSQALITNAKSAMQFAKQNGGNCYQFYASELNVSASERMSIENGLRLALERDEFKLFYQPQINLQTGAIISAEALLRWQHPEFGLLTPDKFLSIAEESGLIIPIGKWVMAEVCRQLLEWQRNGKGRIPLSINVSALQFRKKSFLIALNEIIQQTQLDPALLEFELSDNTLLGQLENSEILQALRNLGVKIAIDDYGTGYSSLSDLKRFPIDKLKIDHSFVIDAHKNADAAAISAAIISLAKHLNLIVAAEGIEDEKDLAFVTAQGCDLAQGNLFSQPISAEALVSFMSANNISSILQRSHALH